MAKPKSTPAAEETPPEVHKLDPSMFAAPEEAAPDLRSFKKKVADAKAAAAPSASILGGSFEKVSKVPQPDLKVEQSDELTEEDVVADDYPNAAGDLLLTKVRIGKPSSFFRMNFDEKFYGRKIYILEHSVENQLSPENYLVANDAYNVLKNEPLVMKDMRDKYTYFYVNEDGVIGVWLVSDRTGGASDAWAVTAKTCVDSSRDEWVKLYTDMKDQSYRTQPARLKFNDPVFPDKTFMELLSIAFKGRIIKGTDPWEHLVIKKKIGA